MTLQAHLAASSDTGAPQVRPASAANIWLTSGTAILLICVLLWLISTDLSAIIILIVCLISIVIPIGLIDVTINKVYQRESAGLGGFSVESSTKRVRRVATKLLGLWLTVGFIALAYWLFPEYTWEFYNPFFRAISLVYPFFIIISIPYFFHIDRRMTNPYDGYWLVGRIVLGKVPDGAKQINTIKQHVLGWIVKAFFLPLMVVFLYMDVEWFQARGISAAFSYDAFWWWITLAFFVDVAYASVGYIFTLRIFDSHIRSPNPFLFGWIVALMCYPPFWNLVQEKYLLHSGERNWEFWMSDYPILYVVWASFLLFLISFYSWATVAFGLRFSNLTHRGIITNGPYAITKHPAYISKNIFWWMSAMPFLTTNGWSFAIKGCLALALINIIYFFRAKTEEWHLLDDPTYVAYSEWIAAYGLFARIGGVLRNLSFLRSNG